MVALRSFSQGGQQALVQAHGDDLAGPVPDGLATALAEPVDVIALLRLVGRRDDVLLVDGLARDRVDSRNAIRNVVNVGTSRSVQPRGARVSLLTARCS